MNPKKPKSRMVRVEAQTLRIHPLAQRGLVPAKLKKLMAELDLDAIGVLHAVEYEIPGHGHGIWIIDGQHRWRALMEHGFGEWPVEVKIHSDVTDSARASELFLKLNDRSPVSPYDKFVNEVKAGFPSAVGILDLLRARGLELVRTSGDGHICCVSALKKIHGLDGGKALALALDTVIAAWGKVAGAVEGAVIEGIGLIYGTYGASVDQAALVKKLAKYPGGAAALVGDAKGLRNLRGATLARCIAEAAIEKYNAGRRTGRLDPL